MRRKSGQTCWSKRTGQSVLVKTHSLPRQGGTPLQTERGPLGPQAPENGGGNGCPRSPSGGPHGLERQLRRLEDRMASEVVKCWSNAGQLVNSGVQPFRASFPPLLPLVYTWFTPA